LIHEIFRKEYTDLMIEDYNSRSKKYKFAPGDTVYRHKPVRFTGPIITGPHKLIKRDGVNTWTISLEEGYEGQNSCHDRVAENQLRKTANAPQLRAGLPGSS
jgi:hypothetical protein